MLGARGGWKSNNFHGRPDRGASDCRVGNVGETHMLVAPALPRSFVEMQVKEIGGISGQHPCMLLHAARPRMVPNVPAFDGEHGQILTARPRPFVQ